MKESYVANQFGVIFREFPLLAPVHLGQAGWPDRFIQLPNSKIVAVELKGVEANKHNYFVLTAFRNTQAAWMAKWQRNGGLGFLFVGVSNWDLTKLGYHIIVFDDWNGWIRVNTQKYYLNQIALYTDHGAIRDWFYTKT